MQRKTKIRARRLILVAACASAACSARDAAERAPVAAAAAGCGESGALSVQLHGSVTGAVDWQSPALTCSGMIRPGGDGARLHFTGGTAVGDNLSFIIALPGLERGTRPTGIPVTVTLIEENRGRFYSNAEVEVCWSDVEAHAPDERFGPGRYGIRGVVYCVAPLAEQNGGGGVSFTDLRYSGWIDWKTPD